MISTINIKEMKKTLFILSLLVIGITANAQTDLHNYHMKDRSVIGQQMNATFFPDAKFYLSLPVVSNINFSFASPVSYNDAFTKTGDSTKINVNQVLTEGEDFHSIDFATTVPLFGFGFKASKKATFSFFANSRTTMSASMPYDLLRFVWNGNGAYIGQNYIIDDIKANVLTYGEVGIGYARALEIVGKSAIIGVRVKYLAGIGSFRTSEDATIGITVDETTYKNTITFNNAALQVAGFDLDSEEPEFGAGNSGFGFDIGAELKVTEKLNASFALNDIGSITWNENVNEIRIKSTTIELDGIDLTTTEDFGDEFGDELDTLFEADTVKGASFKTPLRTNLILGAEYQVSDKGSVFGTYANYFSLGKVRTALAVGYKQEVGKVLAISGTVLKLPQDGVDFGAGLTLRLGFIHLYAAAGGLAGLANPADAKTFNMNLGFNMLFGRLDN